MVTGKQILRESEISIAEIYGVRSFFKRKYDYWHVLAGILYKKLKNSEQTKDLRYIGKCIGEKTYGDPDFEALIAKYYPNLEDPHAKEMRDILGYCCLENGEHTAT